VITPHLPALQVVVPLLSAPLCVLLAKARLAYALTLVVCWIAFAISVLLLIQVMDGGAISYQMGGWAPPWGIELVVDPVNAYVLLIVSAIGALVITYAKPSLVHEIGSGRETLFYTSYLLCLTGLLIVLRPDQLGAGSPSAHGILPLSDLRDHWRHVLSDWCRSDLSSHRNVKHCGYGEPGRAAR
jgi:formate hydrogenlyase subunit 3/multisubunit Na+/H+ antiporter MnhD subunit